MKDHIENRSQKPQVFRCEVGLPAGGHLPRR
jgi:hypothetical protein